MTKKQTYTQIRAKKNWLLHSSSNRRKFKSKGRLSTQKPRRSTASVGNEHIKSSQKRTIFHRLAQFKELFNSYGKMEKSLNLTSIGFGFIDISLLPINMAFLALVNGTQYLNHYFQELCKTIGIMNESLNTGIKDGFKSILFYQRKLVQSTSDMVFPSASYKRQFDDLRKKISDLENEIKNIKTSQTLCVNCHHQGSVKPDSNIPSQVLPPPLPPPPPPPPPPLQPPPPILQFKKKSTASHPQKASSKKEDKKALVVSIDDIKSVKLRKTSSNSTKSDMKSPVEKFLLPRKPLKEIKINSAKKSGVPLITMKDLRCVKLKTKSSENHHIKSCFKTPENNMIVLRRNLRKVSQRRSPGGTPMNKTIQETGVGLTPMMTRALRKKFENANPPSVSPEEPTSPRNSIRGKGQSPVQAFPAFALSPVLSMR